MKIQTSCCLVVTDLQKYSLDLTLEKIKRTRFEMKYHPCLPSVENFLTEEETTIVFKQQPTPTLMTTTKIV